MTPPHRQRSVRSGRHAGPRQGLDRTARLRRTSVGLVAVAALLAVMLVWLTHGEGGGEPQAFGHQTADSPSTTAPAKVTTTTAGAPPSTASPSAGDPLGAAAQSLIDGRQGTIEVAAYDLDTAQTWTLGGSTPQDEASVVKVDILEALLAQSKGQGLASAEQPVAQSMIEESDNDSATDLWDDAGAASGIGSFDASAGLTNTTPSQCVECPGFPWPGWGLTTTTPSDQITLLRMLVQANNLLTAPERQYALGLMENVTSSEQWGVTGGVPAGVTVALKNGWLPLNAADTDWQINSVGWVSGGGRNYLLAVLTTGDPSEQYGIDTIDDLSGMVWNALG